jgi:hypothetical protein
MISGARYSCVPMNDMDRVSVGSVLNSTAVGPPVSPASLLDGFRLWRDRMRGMKVVEQEEEGCLPSRSRLCPPWSHPCPPPSLPREGDHTGRRLTTMTLLLWLVTSPRPIGERERERESVSLCMGRRVWSGTHMGEIRTNRRKHLERRQTHNLGVLFRDS